jgi:hypothetical protein
MPEPAQRLRGYRIALARRLDDVARAQAAALGGLAGLLRGRPEQPAGEQAGHGAGGGEPGQDERGEPRRERRGQHAAGRSARQVRRGDRLAQRAQDDPQGPDQQRRPGAADRESSPPEGDQDH